MNQRPRWGRLFAAPNEVQLAVPVLTAFHSVPPTFLTNASREEADHKPPAIVLTALAMMAS